jgi:hypothetical protein
MLVAQIHEAVARLQSLSERIAEDLEAGEWWREYADRTVKKMA